MHNDVTGPTSEKLIQQMYKNKFNIRQKAQINKCETNNTDYYREAVILQQ